MTSVASDIQRALNETPKRKIEQKYGGTFHTSDPNLPPELEAEWLASIEAFEEQFANAKQTTVRAYVGNPIVKPPAEIPPDRLSVALTALLHLLDTRNVIVHFGSGTSEAEQYRFITEELLDHQIDDIRIDGLTQNFLYEEFHPVPENPARVC